MRAHELTVGRTFGVTFDHGEDFFEALSTFCRDNDIRQGYIPSFIGAFAEAEIVGACEKLADPAAPVWAKTYVTNVEALGAGTLARDPATVECLRLPQSPVGRRQDEPPCHRHS
ncbi:PPC domain-containing DNA-binding protein [Streptomyces sp. SCSIO 30461]|uniref:PPC domain-containing DNA-binding protein n=1 Tax=Streptomyces sp. SCSIO 30461 TaxID=3118085 RepID=UPI0030D55C76